MPPVSMAESGARMQADLRRRWIIVWLLFASTFLNYLDRQTLSVLKPAVKAAFTLDDNGYANIVSGFVVERVLICSPTRWPDAWWITSGAVSR